MVEACNNAKLDKTLELNDALEIEQGIWASFEALPAREHKMKMVEDARLVALAGKEYEEILNDVVLESLKTLFDEEVQSQSIEKDTMIDIDCDIVHEDVIVESI